MSTTSSSVSPLAIAVLLGGPSEEREVSLASGAAVAEALRRRGHLVRTVDPADGTLSARDLGPVDVVFNALHGRFGEDGGVQEILDRLRIPYAGSGVQASRVAFSKSAAKERFLAAGILTPRYTLIHRGDSPLRLLEMGAAIGYPLVVKPDQQGSSLGVSIVRSPSELPDAVAGCFAFGPFGVLEQYVAGTEWTVPLLDDRALPMIEIVPAVEFFDYQAKYSDDRTAYRFEFDVPGATVREIESAGLRAAAALGTAGIVRVDLRLDERGNPWVLEVNTSPGMTDHSLTPKSALRAGMNLGELCETSLIRAIRTQSRRSAA
jgi:D-alanine-D-alanine ligase